RRMVVSERKKVMKLLSRRHDLEQEFATTQDASLQQELDSMIPDLLKYFKCDTVDALRVQYPTTASMQTAAEKTRYFATRKSPHQRTADIYRDFIRSSESDYLNFVRVSRTAFDSLVTSVLPQHPVFKNQSNNGQETIEKQLAITLWRMGHYGKDAGVGEASKIFGLSEGTIVKCTQRCLEALKDIATDVISWPSRGEKQTIKARISDITISSSSSTSKKRTLSESTYDDHRTRIRGDKRGVLGAMGILLRMYVPLATRPLMKDPSEYIIPLPSSVSESVIIAQTGTAFRAVLGEAPASSAQDPESGSLPNKKQKRSSKSASETTKKQEGRRQKGSRRVGRPKGNQQAIDTVPYSIQPPPRESIPGPTSSSAIACDPPEGGPDCISFFTPSPNDDTGTPVNSSYLKRDYGFNVLVVCDPTTRIRFVDQLQPGSWLQQRVLESSPFVQDESGLFDHDDYLVAVESGFPSCKTVIPPYSDSELQSSSMFLLGPDDHAIREPLPQDEVDARRIFNESLNGVRKRAQDCERMLRARFPSLMGLRIQLKDDPATFEFTRSWLLACVTIHNLVLGDDSSYCSEWESHLEEIDGQVQKLQEHQALLMWKREYKEQQPSNKRGRTRTKTNKRDRKGKGKVEDRAMKDEEEQNEQEEEDEQEKGHQEQEEEEEQEEGLVPLIDNLD
ncbi:hypothetical protein BGX28_008988, partial [Mortierella sp. GBA30]